VVSKKGASMPICLSDYPAGHYLDLDLMIMAAGSPPAYSFQLDPSDPAGAPDLLNARGDLDFTRSTKAVGVTINLQNSSGVPLQFDNQKHVVFSFARNYGGTKYPIKSDHYQIRNVQVDPTGQIVTFCYRNTKHDDDNPSVQHVRSGYGIYLIDQNGVVGRIDPGVGNGANK
jgi:hypothetical protein